MSGSRRLNHAGRTKADRSRSASRLPRRSPVTRNDRDTSRIPQSHPGRALPTADIRQQRPISVHRKPTLPRTIQMIMSTSYGGGSAKRVPELDSRGARGRRRPVTCTRGLPSSEAAGPHCADRARSEWVSAPGGLSCQPGTDAVLGSQRRVRWQRTHRRLMASVRLRADVRKCGRGLGGARSHLTRPPGRVTMHVEVRSRPQLQGPDRVSARDLPTGCLQLRFLWKSLIVMCASISDRTSAKSHKN